MNRLILLGFVLVAAVIVGVAVLTDDSGELSPAASRLAGAISGDFVDVDAGRPPSPFTSAEAVCIGDGIVRVIGHDRLTELGVSVVDVEEAGFNPSGLDFTDAERAAVVDAFEACVDLLDAAVASIAPGAGQATLACVRSALGPVGARQLWTWRVGPVDDDRPEGLPERLSIVDGCLIG